MALQTFKRQGVFAPGSLVVGTDKQPPVRDRIRTVRHDTWGYTAQQLVVPNDRLWHAAAINKDSEACGVLIHPDGVYDSDKAFLVSNRSPIITPFRGPLIIEAVDGDQYNPSTLRGETPHRLRVDLYPHEPGWLPDKRSDARYYDERTFSTGSETTILEEWFRGREGLVLLNKIKTVTGSGVVDYIVYAGMVFATDPTAYDAIGSGTWNATGDHIFHWEGRADVIRLTFNLASGTSQEIHTSMGFRDEF